MILQQIMLMVVVFLGLQLFCNPNKQQPTESRTWQQIMGDPQNAMAGAPPTPKMGEAWDYTKGTLYWADATLRYDTAAQLNQKIKEKIDEELKQKEKGVNAETKRQLEAQAAENKQWADIVLADVQYKYALSRNDTNLIRSTAFQTMENGERTLQGTPLWSKSFPIPPTERAPERFPWREQSGKELYAKIVTDLSARNRNDLTYGIFPGYQIIDWLVNLTGRNPGFSYAFAAFLLALFVRAAVYPLAQKQLMWGRRMQQLAPLLKEIREQYTDKKTKQVTNQAELQQKTMALYSEYGMNPLLGCLPMLVQWPLFVAVYQFMLRYQFEFQKGHFLWINPATSTATHGFVAPNLGFRDPTLVVIYGITMVTSTLLMPVSDPTQVKQQRLMGVGMGLLITFFMFTGAFPTPAAFVLYWVFTNLLATIQSLRAYRLPIPPLEKVNTKTGGVFPMPSFLNGQGNGQAKTSILPPSSTGTPAKHKPKKRK